MNVKLRLLTVLSLVVLASACGKDNDTPTTPASEASQSSQASPETENDSKAVPAIIAFDINNIPVTNKDIGEFPFIAPPKGYRYVTGTSSTVDESIRESVPTLYPIGSDRIHLVEGKTLKVTLYNEKQESASERDFSLIQRHYKKTITAAGGIKVFDEKAQSDSDASQSRRQVYIIHTRDAEVWFDIDCSGASCVFTVTRKG